MISSADRSARPQAGRGGRRVAVVLGWLVVLVLCALLLLRPDRRGADHVFVVPRGTAERLATGERVDVIPSELVLRRNDRVVVRNDDLVDHLVGPFGVRAGETVRYRFPRVGRFAGVCSIHPDRTVTFVVR